MINKDGATFYPNGNAARLQNRQVAGLSSTEYFAGVDPGLPICIVEVGAIARQAAGCDECAYRIERRHGVLRGQPDQTPG